VRNTENLGLVGNSNRRLDLSEGEYICILHHDDVMLADNLERKIRLLDDNPKIGFVHSNIMLIDPQGEGIASNIWEGDSRRDYMEEGLEVFPRYVLKMPLSASIFIGAVLARRECYVRLGGFSPKLPHCCDSEMWMRMLLFYSVACIGTPLVKYRVHPMSTSSNFGDWTSAPYLREHYLAVKMIFEKYRERIPDSENLARKVSFVFAEQALRLANIHIGRGELPIGKILFKEAKRLNANIFKREAFWITAAKLMAGPKGIMLYRKVRNALRPC
jgi:GT2 family glycosyltransferase